MNATAISAPISLATALREHTRAAHERAEEAPFMARLLAGELPLEGYAALAAQNHAIYRALEALCDQWRHERVAGVFVMDELTRLPHLEHDLAYLLGPDWRDVSTRLRAPATDRYVAHLQATCADWAGGFIAHHYVRYLGDLSGGQIIRRHLARIYGTAGEDAARFYVFEHIPKIKPFRDRYRELLDGVVLSADEHERVVREANIAFELNRAVFDDLGELTLGASRSR